MAIAENIISMTDHEENWITILELEVLYVRSAIPE